MIVSVVYGGTPEERGPSEKNAKDIAEALKTKGYSVHLIQFGKDIILKLREVSTDIVFLCVQGRGYGDGTFQAMLEVEGIPFTGSGMRAASIINDKILCKLLFDRYNINTPKWDILTKEQYKNNSYDYEGLGYPFVAKAPTQGGSFGIELIKSPEDLPLIEKVFAFDSPILLESYIKGHFYTAGIYEGKNGCTSLPVVEGLDLDHPDAASLKEDSLITFTGAYGIKESSLSPELNSQIQQMALQVYKITGAMDLCRVDFMLSQDNTPHVLEINAVPGLKKCSLMPLSAELAGIRYEDMIEDILLSAVKRR
ncbi:ATP-grasp enzyme, D-alanine-D-alanine ligase [Lachnospiraceae bacterium JC7]|nr:ATP-grasp enzyme, D-alanine-D-alanine ligase [Lachnospiraceae bacterium JC7]